MRNKLVVFLMFAVFVSAVAVPLRKKADTDSGQSSAPAVQDSGQSESKQDKVPPPIAGHKIKVDKDISDWVGDAPAQDNMWAVDKGEYIWKDASGDDHGQGKYTYPTNAVYGHCADILEFRVTWDSQFVYMMIKCSRPGDWWAPYKVIGIHKDGSSEPFTTLLAQGSYETKIPEEGCLGNLRVAPELACQYVIGLSTTWKGFIWNAKGKLVAKRKGKEGDTPGFSVDDCNWSAIEVAVPISIIGSPAGQTWKFIVASGLEEFEHMRPITKEQSEWHGGGGEGDENTSGANPNVYDLIGAPRDLQEKDLAGYDQGGSGGDSSGFATITNSYVTVRFADKPAE